MNQFIFWSMLQNWLSGGKFIVFCYLKYNRKEFDKLILKSNKITNNNQTHKNFP